MRIISPVLALALIASTALAAPPTIKLPEKIEAKPSTFITVKAETDGKKVQWIVPPGLSAFPPELLADKKTMVFTTGEEGTYIVEAYTALGDEPSGLARCIIQVGRPVPPPPPPPPPDDSLVKAIKAAMQAETAPDKVASLSQLADLYIQTAKLMPKLKAATWGELFKKMGESATTLGVAGKILGVQDVVMQELLKSLPKAVDKPLDDDGKALAATVFSKIGGSLLEAGK